jgi:hypothetical protein
MIKTDSWKFFFDLFIICGYNDYNFKKNLIKNNFK